MAAAAAERSPRGWKVERLPRLLASTGLFSCSGHGQWAKGRQGAAGCEGGSGSEPRVRGVGWQGY